MPIDKSWTILPKRSSVEFLNGLEVFMEMAKKTVNAFGTVRCPCNKCHNFRFETPDVVSYHITRNGFTPNYDIWVHHGENESISENNDTCVVDDDFMVRDEMFDVLSDLTGRNNEKVVDNTNVVEDNTTDSAQYYDALLEEMEVELYPGCKNFSSLNFLVKLMHIKVKNKWTNKSFDELLELLKESFPEGNTLPESHYGAKTKLAKLGLGYTKIDVCKYDCALYWKENANCESCPVCSTSRWVDAKTKGKKVPHKVMRYFPLTPRLKRLYASRHTAEDMRWHFNGRSKEEGVLRHPVDAEAWINFDKQYPDFASEPRNVRLVLAADGFNPFGHMSVSYSMSIPQIRGNKSMEACMDQFLYHNIDIERAIHLMEHSRV